MQRDAPLLFAFYFSYLDDLVEHYYLGKPLKRSKEKMVLADAASQGPMNFKNVYDEIWQRDYQMISTVQCLLPMKEPELVTRKVTCRTNGPDAFEEEWEKVDDGLPVSEEELPRVKADEWEVTPSPQSSKSSAQGSKYFSVTRWSFGLKLPSLFGYR